MTDATPNPAAVAAPRIWRAGLYASGNFAKNIVWSASELALLVVFTDLFGVPPALAGGLILASLVLDAMLDPLIGAYADRLGRFCPLVFAGAPLLGISFAALLAGPAAGLSGVWFAAAALFALRIAYSVVDIPHNALLARMARPPADRTALASARFLFSAAATLALGSTLPAILAIEPERTARDALAVWALVASGAVTVVLIGAAWAALPWDKASATEPIPTPRAIARQLLSPLASPQVRAVLILAAFGNALTPLAAKVALYFSSQAYGDAAIAGGAIVALAIGQIAGLPLWIFAARQWGEGRSLMLAHCVAAAGALPMLAGAGLPREAFTVTLGLYGVGTGGVYTLIWTLAAVAADKVQSESGSSGGAVFGLAIMVMQIASGIGSSLLGAVLALAGYAPHAGASPPIALTVSAFALGPALAALGAGLILLRPARQQS